jgi:hypothetical protein
MGDPEFVSPEMCSLHREVITTKLEACNERVDGLMEKVDEIITLQRNTIYGIAVIFGTLVLILLGVLLGRSVDFGLLIP